MAGVSGTFRLFQTPRMLRSAASPGTSWARPSWRRLSPPQPRLQLATLSLTNSRLIGAEPFLPDRNFSSDVGAGRRRGSPAGGCHEKDSRHLGRFRSRLMRRGCFRARFGYGHSQSVGSSEDDRSRDPGAVGLRPGRELCLAWPAIQRILLRAAGLETLRLPVAHGPTWTLSPKALLVTPSRSCVEGPSIRQGGRAFENVARPPVLRRAHEPR